MNSYLVAATQHPLGKLAVVVMSILAGVMLVVLADAVYAGMRDLFAWLDQP